MPLEVGGVGQHQVGEGHSLALEGVANHQKRDQVLTLVVLAVQHLAHRHGVHGRVPGHVGHEDHQRVEAVGVALDRIGDDVVHHAVGGERVFPRERVVDANRRAVGIDRQFFRAGRKTQRRRIERRVRLDQVRRVERAVVGHDMARVRRLVAKSTRRVDGAEQAHQYGQRAHGLEAI